MRTWMGASFAAPFLFVAVALRLAEPGVGDRIARRLVRVAAVLPHLLPDPAPRKARVGNAPRPPCAVGVEDGGTSLLAHIPSARVSTMIDDNGRTLHTSAVRGADAEPAGVRVTGVSRLGVGLLDEDVLVCVEGEATTDEDAAIDAALSAIARGATALHATAVRGDQIVRITADWPPAPILGAMGKVR